VNVAMPVSRRHRSENAASTARSSNSASSSWIQPRGTNARPQPIGKQLEAWEGFERFVRLP